MIPKYTPFLIMEAGCISLTYVTAKNLFQTISCIYNRDRKIQTEEASNYKQIKMNNILSFVK